MEPELTPGLLGATAASRYLGVSRATLHRLVQSGDLVPAHRTASGYRRFSTLELHRFRTMRHQVSRDDLPDREDALGEHMRRQGVLLDLAERICGPHTVQSMCMAAATVARDALSSGDCASIWLVDGRGEFLLPSANVGYPAPYDMSPFPITRGSITARALQTGQPVACEDVLLRPLPGSDIARIQSADLSAYVSVPIIGSKHLRGMLLVGCRHPAAFPPEDIAFLTRLAKLLAHSLQTAQQVEQYEQVYELVQGLSGGVTDGMTAETLASLAASGLGLLTHADHVLVSFERSESEQAASWLALWSVDSVGIEDLPAVPQDPAVQRELRGHRRTVRIDDIYANGTPNADAMRLVEMLRAPTWQLAPFEAVGVGEGSISLGFSTRIQLSQLELRSVSVVAAHLGLALSALARTPHP